MKLVVNGNEICIKPNQAYVKELFSNEICIEIKAYTRGKLSSYEKEKIEEHVLKILKDA